MDSWPEPATWASLSVNTRSTSCWTSTAIFSASIMVALATMSASAGRTPNSAASSASRPCRSHCSSIELSGTKRATVSATTSSRMPWMLSRTLSASSSSLRCW
jgi:hypothetical protein